MSGRVLAGVALAALLATHQPAVAGPPAPGPDGLGCGYLTVTDPGSTGGGFVTAALFGGPIVGDGTLTCTVQVGASRHSGPDAVPLSASGTGVVALPPTVVSFVAPPDIPIYVCTQWTDANGTVYWHPTEDPDGVPKSGDETPGHWTADADKPCAVPVGEGGADNDPPPMAVVDVIVCPVLKLVYPPEGDIHLIWDCPPYGSGASLGIEVGDVLRPLVG